MEGPFSPEVLTRVKEAVKAKLKELDKYIDDELPDYVIVLVANKRTREQMHKDLKLFLGTATESFVTWLQKTMSKINKAAVGASSETPPSAAKEETAKAEKSPEKRKRRHSNKSLSPKRSIRSPSLSPPPTSSKRLKGRLRMKSTSSEKRKRRSSGGRSDSESESAEKRRKPTLTSIVAKARRASDEEPEKKLPSLVEVKERPKVSRKGAPSSRLLLKAVRDSRSSPEPSSTLTPQKLSIKDRLGKIGDVQKVIEGGDVQNTAKDEESDDDGGLQLLLEESEEDEPVEEKKEEKKAETKFIVTLEGLDLNRSRSAVKDRLGAGKTAERRGSVKNRLGYKSASKVVPEAKKEERAAVPKTTASKSPVKSVSVAKKESSGAASKTASSKSPVKKRSEKDAAERKAKPSLAVEPVVQDIKPEIVDKKALRAERFKSLSVSKPVVMKESDVVMSSKPVASSVPAPSLTPATPALEAFNKTKCAYWPNCKRGSACLFYHPSVPSKPAVSRLRPVPVPVPVIAAPMCATFPHCPFGEACKFGHPPCKFGDGCLNAACPFTHVRVVKGKPCFYGAGCRNPACTFFHPSF